MSGNAASRVVLSSVCTKWNNVVVEQHHFPISEMADLMYKQHVIVINAGYAMTCEYKKEGQFRRFFKARGAISFFPSGQSFFLPSKLERGMFANFLFLALDPVFVSRIAQGLELDSEGIGLIERRRSTDPTLHHIAMAFRAGVQSGDGLDRMYGEGLSTALASHLLREYGAAAKLHIMLVSPIRAILHVISKEFSAYLLRNCSEGYKTSEADLRLTRRIAGLAGRSPDRRRP